MSQLDWPGNIRQLENAVYRAVVMSESDQLGLPDFPQAPRTPAPDDHCQHSEPLIVGTSTAPAMVSGNEIPIAPAGSAGNLPMLTSAGEVRPLEEMENEIIRFAISHYRGQMSEVARRLKIGRSTLYRKLDEAAANDRADRRRRRTEPSSSDYGAGVASTAQDQWHASRPEPSNRGLPVTDKRPRRVAKARNPNANGVVSRSVCRELPRMALAA